MMTGATNKNVNIMLTGSFRAMDMSSHVIVHRVSCRGSRTILPKLQKIAHTKIAPSANNCFNLTGEGVLY